MERNVAGNCVKPPILGNGNTGSAQVYVEDIDGDGRLDLIAGRAGSKLKVFTNVFNGNTTSFVDQSISDMPLADEVAHVVVADLVSNSTHRKAPRCHHILSPLTPVHIW
jgi:hypothetical protein